jgi:hypothetical protein
MGATEKLWHTATELRPDDPTRLQFDSGIREKAVEALANGSPADEAASSSAAEASGFLSNQYEAAANNLFDKVMTADSVVKYAMDASQQAERKKQIIGFGSTALAALIGTAVAIHVFNKKR